MGNATAALVWCASITRGKVKGGNGDGERKRTGETYRPSVPNTPSDNAPGVAFGADLQREDLGRIEPGHGQPGGTEAGGEDEGEGRTCGAVGRSLGLVVLVLLREGREAAGQEHGDAHDDVAPVQSHSATEPVEGEDGDEGGELLPCE